MSESYGKAVIGGKLQYTSVSAIDRLAGCDTSYFFRYVEGIPDPAGPAAQRGTEGHKRIEHYLLTGEEVLGPIERAGLQHIPAPIPVGGPGLSVELKVDGVLDANGVPLKGGMDLLNERDLLDEHGAPGGNIAVLTDWKFKSEIGTTEENLRDPHHSDGRQMLGYAETYFRLRPKALRVWLRHVHFGTKKRESGTWKVLVERAEVRMKWQLVADTYVSRMHAVAAAKGPGETSVSGPRTGQCFKFFKACVYIDRCPVGGVDLMLMSDRDDEPSNSKESPMGLLSSKMSSLTSTTPPPAPPAVPAVTTPAPAPAVPTGPVYAATTSNPPLVRMLDLGAAYQLPGGRQGRLEQVEGQKAQFLVSPTERVIVELKDVGLQTAPAVALVQAPDAPLVPPEAITPPAPVEVAPISPTTESGSHEVPKRGRGRPKKEVTIPIPEGQRAEVGELLNAETAPTTVSIQNATDGHGVCLYFTGAPLGKVTQSLSAYVAELEKYILTTLGEKVPDVRMGNPNGPLGYGKWKAVIEQRAREVGLPPPGHYLVGNGEKEQAVAYAIADLAQLAVMGG
jgi:hypothetical protein